MSQQDRNTDADRRRRRLYEAFDDEALPLAEKRDRALEIGREYLGVENGHVERIVDGGETHEIVASVGREQLVPVGMEIDQSKTFCRQTIEQHEPLAVSDAISEGWADDPAYIEQGIACYLGTPIFVEGDTYGTVCFVSEAPRERSFDAAGRAFVELVARLLGREIESRRHERRLDERDREIERSEQKYESLLAAAPDAILLTDTEDGRIVETNAAAASLTGYDESALQGRVSTDLQPAGATDRYRELFEGGFDGVETRSRFDDGTPFEIEHRDGSHVPVEISATMVTLDGEEYVQAIVRDISERRERERELRVKNRAIDTASIGVSIAAAEEGAAGLRQRRVHRSHGIRFGDGTRAELSVPPGSEHRSRSRRRATDGDQRAGTDHDRVAELPRRRDAVLERSDGHASRRRARGCDPLRRLSA